MINILFTGKNLRARRRETIINPPIGIKFFTQQEVTDMPEDYMLTNQKRSNRIAYHFDSFINYGMYIKKKYLKHIDLIYSPGKVIYNKTPWIIEIDNITSMAYYSPKLLDLIKPLIKRKLKSKYCKAIICLSEAAKKGMMNYFKDQNINKKCHVVYPYIKEEEIKNKNKKDIIKFLFISSSFYIKGGREILNVFRRLKNRNIKLTIITKKKELQKEHFQMIENNKNIEYVEANLTKNKVYDFYRKSDIFILPTYQDSFGLVYLEALAFGLPIIATKQYNLPELVKNNGFLIKPAFYYFNEKGIPNKKYWTNNLNNYILKNEFRDVEDELYKIIKQILAKPEIIEEMSKKSLKLFKDKFIVEKRNKQFGEILKKCVE